MRQALWTRASCAKKSHQKPFRLAAFSQYAKQATSVRRAEARPTRKSRICLAWRRVQRLSRLAASHRARAGNTDPVAEALLFAAIRVGVFSALGFVLAKGNPRFAGSLVCVVLCFSQF